LLATPGLETAQNAVAGVTLSALQQSRHRGVDAYETKQSWLEVSSKLSRYHCAYEQDRKPEAQKRNPSKRTFQFADPDAM
jgi:hypothetical protein